MMALNFGIILLCLLYPLLSGHCPASRHPQCVSLFGSNQQPTAPQDLNSERVPSPHWPQVWSMHVYILHASADHSSWGPRVLASVQHHAINGSCRVRAPEFSPHPIKDQGELRQDEERPGSQE